MQRNENYIFWQACQSEKKEEKTLRQKRTKEIRRMMAAGLMMVFLLAFTACGKKAAGLHHVEIEIENYGTIKVELDGDAAPITVENFLSLAEDGFYDGLTFHRVVDGFMIQGGDPEGNSSGGSGKTIKGEFAANGVENSLDHTRGAISMARSEEYDSASSQFFIVQEDSSFLNGNYAAFGYVTEGIEIVDQICADTPVINEIGLVAKENQPVITSITVVD